MRIERFDPAKMAQRAVTLIIGGRSSGKSVLCADLLRRRRSGDERGALVCETLEVKESECRRMFAPDRVHSNYSPRILRDVVAEQKRLIREASGGAVGACHVVLDDVLFSDEDIRETLKNGRRLRIDLMVTMTPRFAPPACLRANADYVFVLREVHVDNRRRLYERYAGILPTFEAFQSVLDQTTRDYGCLVIDNTVHCTKPEDGLFFYRADCHIP